MSQLSEIVNAGAEVIPGYILSKPGLLEIGKAEVFFAQRYMEMIAHGCAGLPQSLALPTLKDAKEDVKLAQFAYGGSIFEVWALAKSSVPFLTLLSLQVKHGDKVDMNKVAAMYAEGDADAIAARTWDLWGYGPDKKKGAGVGAVPADPPTGTPSTDVSADPAPTDSGSAPSSSGA